MDFVWAIWLVFNAARHFFFTWADFLVEVLFVTALTADIWLRRSSLISLFIRDPRLLAVWALVIYSDVTSALLSMPILACLKFFLTSCDIFFESIILKILLYVCVFFKIGDLVRLGSPLDIYLLSEFSLTSYGLKAVVKRGFLTELGRRSDNLRFPLNFLTSSSVFIEFRFKGDFYLFPVNFYYFSEDTV